MSTRIRQAPGVRESHPLNFPAGTVVELHPVYGGYPLPHGCGPGFQVRIVRWKNAYAIVEREGREWQVFMANLRKPSRPSKRA